MKHNIITAIVLILGAQSCTISKEITINTEPSTEIYDRDFERVATADEYGHAHLRVNVKDYHAFYLSKRPNSEEYIPFAIDYKKRSKAGIITFSTLLGVIPAVMSATAIACGEDAGLAILESTIFSLPVVPGLTTCLVNNKKNLGCSFLSKQVTNHDLKFEKSKTMEISTMVHSDVSTQTELLKKSKEPLIGQKSNKSLNDYAMQVQGDYVGNGSLRFEGNVLESYTSIKIVISRIEKDKVAVNVVESNGEQFFTQSSPYMVKKNSDGSFTLISCEIDSAKIIIQTGKNAQYNHPMVNIDGDIYELTISASR